MPDTDPLTELTSGKPSLGSLITKHSDRTGLDPELVRRLVSQESRGKQQAVSPKGAGGLTQLMPGTAAQLGVKNVFDPDENIRGGTDYLKQQLDRFGDVNLALAAYNAGPGAVIKHGNKVPPYTETQNYVKKIAGGYQGTGYAQDPLTELTKPQKVQPQVDPLTELTQPAPQGRSAAMAQTVSSGMQGAGPSLTSNDAAWHFGMTPDEAKSLTPRAMRVLQEAVTEDQRKKSLGQDIQQPSIQYQNEMRAKAKLPLKSLAQKYYNGADAENKPLGGNPLMPSVNRPEAFADDELRKQAEAKHVEGVKGGLRSVNSLIGSPLSLLPDSAQDWINTAMEQGGASMVNTTAGLIKHGVPALEIAKLFGAPDVLQKPVAEKLSQVASQMASDASMVDESSNRGRVSKTLHNVVAGGIGSSPAVILTSLGVPASVAFGMQANAEAQGQSKNFLDTLSDTVQGATIGKLFELPMPAKLSLLQKAGARFGTVGGVTYGLDKLKGNPDAFTNALVNGAFAATGIGEEDAAKGRTLTQVPDIQAKLAEREASVSPAIAPSELAKRTGLREGANETQAQPNITPQPESAEPAKQNLGNQSAPAQAALDQQGSVAERVGDIGQAAANRPAGENALGGTDEAVSNIRQVDLQPRRQRGDGKGQFKEETKAQRESRLAQVTPPEAVTTPQASQTAEAAEPEKVAASTPEQPTVVPAQADTSIGAAIPKDANLTEASQNGSIIYFEFDGMKPVPTAEQMKAALTTEGATADVVRYEPNVISGARGTVRFRADVYDENGRMSSKAAERVYQRVFGTKERISGKTTLSGILTPEEQFKLGVGVSKARDLGEPISDPRQAAPRQVEQPVPQTPVEAATPNKFAASPEVLAQAREALPQPIETKPNEPTQTDTSVRPQPQSVEDGISRVGETAPELKGDSSAISKQISGGVDVRQQTGDGKALGEGNTVNQIPPKAEAPSGSEASGTSNQKVGKRSFPKTLAESGREQGTNLTYDVITNPESRAQAKATVESKGIDGAMSDLRSSEGAHRTALGIELIDKATQAAKDAEAKGDLTEAARHHEQAIEAASVASENLTKAGQEVQAAQIANRYTPEGAMLESARIAKSTNVPLKVEDAQKTSQYAQRVADAEKRISELEETVKGLKSAKVAPKGTSLTVKPSKIQTAKDYFAQLESDAKARLEARKTVSIKGSEAGASTIPLDIADWTIIGASKIAKGGLNYAEWQTEMIKDLGERVKPHLERIFTDATNQVKDKRAAVNAEMKSRAAAKNQKPGQSLADALEELNSERARARQSRRDLDRHFREMELSAQKGKLDAFLSLTRDSLLSLRGLGRILSGMTGKQAIDLAGKLPATVSDIVLSKALGTPRTTTLPSFGTLLRTVGGFAERVGPAAKSAFKGEASEIMPEAYPQPKSESPYVTYTARIMQKLYGSKESVIRSWAYPREMEERARTFAVNDAREGLIKRSQVDQRARDYIRGRVEFDGKENQRLAQSLAEQAAKYEVQSKQIIPSMEKTRTRDMVKSPTELLHSLALQGADKAVYAQPNIVSKGLSAAESSIKQSMPESRIPLEVARTTVLPFVKRPANNIADSLLGYTGAKIPIEGARLIRDAINKEFKPSQVKAFNDAVGKGTAGFAVMAVGAALNKKGVLTSPLDKDHPASIKVGDKYYSVGYVPVVGWLLGMGAAYQQNGAKAVPISMAKMILEHPLLRSAKDISEGVTNLAKAKVAGSGWIQSAEAGGSKYIGQTVARIIPAPVKIASEASDAKERDTRGLTGPLKAAIPGLRQTLPEVGEKPRTSAINPFYSKTTTKQTEWDKKSPPEKLARQQRRRYMNEEDLRTEDEINRDKRLAEIRRAARAEPRSATDDKPQARAVLQSLVNSGQLSLKKGDAILNTPSDEFLDDVQRGSLTDALNVYDIASPRQRQDLMGIIIRKRHLLNEMSGNDRGAAENRLKKLGIPLSGQVPPREVPKKMFLQNVIPKVQPVIQSAP